MASKGQVWCLLVAAAMFFPAAFGQSVAATVMVGANGTFFTPTTVAVNLKDIVRFIFVGTAHSVTQTSLDNPCFQLPGGFSSGIEGVKNASVSAPPFWDLEVTDVTQPIWFYCAITAPQSHCAAGMVGAINPPSIEAYNQFLASAKLVTALPTAFPTNALAGQGATATAFPATSSGAPGQPSPTPSSSTSNSTSNGTAPTSAAPNKGTIIGVSVGGVMALVTTVIFLAWL